MVSRLLIVEDDRDLARNLIDFLELQGYATHHAADGQTALSLLAANDYDLVILDLMLPGVDGMSVCIHIRNQLQSRVPIVILTAKSEIDTKISAFDIGADDYVIKPISLREINARVRALIRRAKQADDNAILTIGGLSLDTGTMRIERDGVPITLPPGPTKILALLMRNSPNVVHNLAIHHELWGEERGDTHAIVVHMHTLRNTIDKPFDRQLIHTVRGFGYRIADEQTSL
ncbi:MAG: response regulator transcription factor [Propionivibrio sp.]|nr:response regulator transcription factor [Propionivibrio sp.]